MMDSLESGMKVIGIWRVALHSLSPEDMMLDIAVYNMQFNIGTLRTLIAARELCELALGKHASCG